MARTFTAKQIAAQKAFAKRFSKAGRAAAAKAGTQAIKATVRADRAASKAAAAVARRVPVVGRPLAFGVRGTSAARQAIRTGLFSAAKLVPRLLPKFRKR